VFLFLFHFTAGDSLKNRQVLQLSEEDKAAMNSLTSKKQKCIEHTSQRNGMFRDFTERKLL